MWFFQHSCWVMYSVIYFTNRWDLKNTSSAVFPLSKWYNVSLLSSLLFLFPSYPVYSMAVTSSSMARSSRRPRPRASWAPSWNQAMAPSFFVNPNRTTMWSRPPRLYRTTPRTTVPSLPAAPITLYTTRRWPGHRQRWTQAKCVVRRWRGSWTVYQRLPWWISIINKIKISKLNTLNDRYNII